MIVWQLTWVISWSFFVFSVAVAMFSAHHDYRPTAAGPGVPNLGWLRMRTTAPVEVSLFKAKRCLHGVSLFWCDLKHCYVMLPRYTDWWWLEPWNGKNDFPETVGNGKSSQLTHIFQRGRYTTNQYNTQFVAMQFPSDVPTSRMNWESNWVSGRTKGDAI